jgi:hypothetical protein
MSDFDANFNRDFKVINLFCGLVTLASIGIFVLIVLRIVGTVASGSKGVPEQARTWATSMGLDAIGASCAGMDTDGDGYVSCTVSSREPGGTVKLTPVECAVSYMPDGCRIPKPASVYGVQQGY